MVGDQLANNMMLWGAAAAGFGAICKFVALPLYRIGKRLGLVHDAVLTQLVANGGTSLVDRVGAIEDDICHIQGHLGCFSEKDFQD